MIKVAHVSSVHSRYDTRILFNQCTSLSSKYDTTFFVCDGKDNEVINDVKIRNCYVVEGRIKRILTSIFILIFYVWKKNIKIYHLHDPELFFLAVILKFTGKKVIFDVHEDYYLDFQNKSWLNSNSVALTAKIYKVIFYFVFRFCDDVITVTEKIQGKIGCDAKLIKNYPDLTRFKSQSGVEKKFSAIYVGSISIERGIQAILDLKNKFALPIAIAGNFADPEVEEMVLREVENGELVYLGFIVPNKVPEILNSASIGVHLVSNNENLLSGLPVKIFEYIASGLPIICSQSETWEKYFSEFPTVQFVDPYSSDDVEIAIKNCERITPDLLIESQLRLDKKYSWNSQHNLLLDIYDKACAY